MTAPRCKHGVALTEKCGNCEISRFLDSPASNPAFIVAVALLPLLMIITVVGIIARVIG